MSYAQALRDAILQAAMQGKLTEQLSSDSSAENMFRLIEAEKANGIKSEKIKRDNSCSIKKYNPLEDGIFEIPSSWRWVKLGEICQKIGAGSTPSGGSKVYVSEGVKFLREQNVRNEGISYEGIVYIPEEIHSLMDGSKVIAKDILLNITGASIGRNSLVPDDFDTANVNQHVLVIRFIDDRLRLYVHLCLQAPFVYNQMMTEQKGDKPGLSATRVSNFLIPLPPIEEQQRIVDRVNELLAKVDEFEKIENRLTAAKEKFPSDLRAAILQAAMQGKLTEQLDTDSSVKEMLCLIEKNKIEALNGKINKSDKRLFIKLSEEEETPYDIPQSWKWCTLGFILNKLTDGTHKTPHYTATGKRFLSVKDVSSGKIDFSNTKFISEEEHKTLFARCNPQKGDMLLTKVGTTGVPAYVDTNEEFSLFVSVALLKFDHRFICPQFLYYLICSPLVQKQAEENTRGVGNQNWVLDKIARTQIVLPPIEEQQRIVERLDALLPLCDELTGE